MAGELALDTLGAAPKKGSSFLCKCFFFACALLIRHYIGVAQPTGFLP